MFYFVPLLPISVCRCLPAQHQISDLCIHVFGWKYDYFLFLFILFISRYESSYYYLPCSFACFSRLKCCIIFYSIFDVRISSVLSIVFSAFSSPIALKFVHIILLTCSSSLLSGYCLCLLQCKCFSAPCLTPISRFTLIKFERFQ